MQERADNPVRAAILKQEGKAGGMTIMMMSRVVTMDQRQAVRQEMIQQMEQEAGLGFVQKSIRGV